ncbi:TonB-linked SusC/RagA family outer membrane protein [Dysgonomonas alginatilytica]|uniref:TonB-linked SusC/RagA family outer membrane protein n=1 Tax=Dysgonomonas alginatilytica TaxID=1605892 RepID=A0A2V3PK71_9BACT|nr:TonB-dependent receptor [Dysgonomonas alginatilytica]PXV58911.1 TonB-linked SusC/RagA family outer membrane protein [Dysgonomonas alginatilytica]
MNSKKKMRLMKSWQKTCLAIMLLMLPALAFAQSVQVTGNVKDQTGEAIIGATVVVKNNSSTGTVTDFDGNYTISVPGNATLVFSYLGMETAEVAVNGQTKLDITLKDDSRALDEVVVVGYGTMRKKDLTTAVASVSSKEWADRPVISAQQALQGKAAGVQVIQPSGKPGAGLTVRVRGTTSLNAGNDPLYVVDGIPTNDITNISPTDIESLQILKDASSAAIYGARAANGVVLITTKKGTAGRSEVNVSMFAGFSNVAKTIKTLNTTQYYDLLDEIYGVGIADRSKTTYTDWAKDMYDTGVKQNYQVSLSGGTDKVNYFISGGYQDERGIIKPASYSRYSFRSNTSAQTKDWLKVISNVSFAKTSRRDVVDNANSGRGGVVMSILNTPPFMEKWDPLEPSYYYRNPYNGSWENPYAQANTYDMNSDYRFMGNVGLDFIITKELHFKPSFAVDYTGHKWDKFIDPVKTTYGREANGRGEHADDDYLTWLSENIVTFDKKIDGKHNLSLLGGGTFQKFKHNNTYMSVQDFVKGTNLENMTLNMANKINDATTTAEANTLVSVLGRVQYDYESRYLFTANMRADGSSKLAPGNRWGYFPSVSAGWRFSSESFFLPITNVVNDAKLRLAWGQNGNQNGIGSYDYLQKYKINKTQQSDGSAPSGPNITADRYGNQNLKWETTTQFNAGLDISLFNSRVTGEFDLYYKKTTDLLLYITLPSSIGRDLPMRNDGEMINKGFEFNITGHILTGTLLWDASANMSFNRNKLSKLGLTPQYTTARLESNNADVIIMKEGLPLGSFYGYISEGVDPETGDIKYKDLNNNGITGGADPNDRTVIGNAQPDFTFGFTNNFTWKNITLSAFVQGSYGNDIYNATRLDSEGMFDQKNQTTTVLNRWMRPGMITDVPRAVSGNGNVLNSTRFVEDGSYIRLKALTLAYNFNKKLLQPLGIAGLSVYGTADNLVTLTKYRGYDPELSWINTSTTTSGAAAQMGIDMGTFPQTRSFIFGLNLTF